MNKNIIISFSAKEGEVTSELLMKMYREEIEKLGVMEADTLSMKTIYINEELDKIEAKVLFINTTSHNINFNKVDLQLIDKDKKIIIQEGIDLTDMGVIPPMNARPYTIYFTKVEKRDYTTGKECRVFMKPTSDVLQARIIKDTYFDNNLKPYEITEIQKYLDQLPPKNDKEFELICYKHLVDENNIPRCILIFINPAEQDTQLKPITLIYKDAVGFVRALKKVERPIYVRKESRVVYSIPIDPECIVRPPFNVYECRLSIELTK